MRRRRRFDLGKLKQRWPEFLLATLLSLALAVAVVRIGLIYNLGSRAAVAAPFAPNHPRVLASAIDLELTANRGLVTDQTRAAATRLVRRAPMLEDPMLVAGIEALLAKDDRKAKQLLGHALARNPRSEFVRLLMLELDLRTGDVQRAVSDMAILGRLLPDVQTVFVPELSRLARDPRTSRTLASALSSDPSMLAKVLRHMAENGASPRRLLELAGGIPTQAPPDEQADWREALLKAMVSRGDAQGAHRLWAAFAGLKQAPASDAVYDEGFHGLPGLPPFNWAFIEGEFGAAEREKDGGLHVEYYGRDRGDLAMQLITLPPGPYRLGVHVEGDIHDTQHRLFWRVHCARPDDALLVELPIANITFAGRTIAGDFDVPTGCSAQWLKLVGEPTEFPKNESATVRRIRIVRLTRSS